MPLRLGDLFCRANSTPVKVHEVTVRHRMGKDHTAITPVTGGMRPGTRRRIADTVLQRQGQGNTALLQVRFATAPRQGSLERGELLG